MRLRREQIKQATGGESGDAEHQVAEYLEVAADTQMTTTVVVLDGAIGALGGGALIVDQVIRVGHVDGAAGGAFGGNLGLQRGLPCVEWPECSITTSDSTPSMWALLYSTTPSRSARRIDAGRRSVPAHLHCARGSPAAHWRAAGDVRYRARRIHACAAPSDTGPRVCAGIPASARATIAISHAPGREPPRRPGACRLCLCQGRGPPAARARGARRRATSPARPWPSAAPRAAAATARRRHRTARSPVCPHVLRPRRAPA